MRHSSLVIVLVLVALISTGCASSRLNPVNPSATGGAAALSAIELAGTCESAAHVDGASLTLTSTRGVLRFRR